MMNRHWGGLDEAGRGPLAGPVTAGACILPPGFDLSLLGDSKALTERRRERAFEAIQALAAWGLGWCTPSEIDELNILQASLVAMQRAWQDLELRFPGWFVEKIVVDGTFVPQLRGPVVAMVRADALVPEVSAASIIAKVSRDRVMLTLDRDFPQYGFAQHKGYPTQQHREALAQFGPSPHHRKTFRGVRELLL